MKRITIILSLFILIASSCNLAKKDQLTTEDKPSEEQQTEEKNQPLEDIKVSSEREYLITEKGVGIFLIGQKFPIETKGYQITKDIEVRAEEGTDFEILIYTISENGHQLLSIEQLFENSNYEIEKISDMLILSDKIKTAEGIGINSSIEEFMATYPDFNIWFSYISGRYVIETPKLKEVQFFLDGNDFIDEAGPAFDSDMTILKPSEFKKGAKIKRVRIYG